MKAGDIVYMGKKRARIISKVLTNSPAYRVQIIGCDLAQPGRGRCVIDGFMIRKKPDDNIGMEAALAAIALTSKPAGGRKPKLDYKPEEVFDELADDIEPSDTEIRLEAGGELCGDAGYETEGEGHSVV